MAQQRRATVLLLGLALVAGSVGSSCSGQTRHGAGSTATTLESSRPLPPLKPRLARRRIVFVDEIPGSGDPFGAIDSIRLDGRGFRRIVTSTSEFAISPDRTQIAYNDDGTDHGGIHVIRTDGSRNRWIDHESGETLDGQPAWSPDGRQLVFIKTVSPAPSGALFASTLYVINADGTGRRPLVGSAVDFPGATWIDGREILTTYRWGELAIIDARRGQTIDLIELPRKGTQPGDGPRLAPTGDKIAVGECDNPDCSYESVDVITLSGVLLRRIGGAHTPAWTPDGGLLYACCQQAHIRGNTSRIMFAPADGGPARAITPSSLSADNPAWLG